MSVGFISISSQKNKTQMSLISDGNRRELILFKTKELKNFDALDGVPMPNFPFIKSEIVDLEDDGIFKKKTIKEKMSEIFKKRSKTPSSIEGIVFFTSHGETSMTLERKYGEVETVVFETKKLQEWAKGKEMASFLAISPDKSKETKEKEVAKKEIGRDPEIIISELNQVERLIQKYEKELSMLKQKETRLGIELAERNHPFL